MSNPTGQTCYKPDCANPTVKGLYRHRTDKELDEKPHHPIQRIRVCQEHLEEAQKEYPFEINE